MSIRRARSATRYFVPGYPYALDLDSSEYIEPGSISLGSVFTVSALVNLDTDKDYHDSFGSESHLTLMSYSDGAIKSHIGDGNGWVNNLATSAGATTPGVYQRWTVTYDGSTLTLFLDGSQAAYVSVSVSVPSTIYHIGGRNGQDSDYGLRGREIDIRVWNYTRTQDQIQRDMHRRLSGREPGLVGYWPLWEGSGSTAYDRSGNGNHGTIEGATWTTG